MTVVQSPQLVDDARWLREATLRCSQKEMRPGRIVLKPLLARHHAPLLLVGYVIPKQLIGSNARVTEGDATVRQGTQLQVANPAHPT